MTKIEVKEKVSEIANVKFEEIDILIINKSYKVIVIDFSNREEEYSITYKVLKKLSEFFETDYIEIETNSCNYVKLGFCQYITIETSISIEGD